LFNIPYVTGSKDGQNVELTCVWGISYPDITVGNQDYENFSACDSLLSPHLLYFSTYFHLSYYKHIIFRT